MKRKKVIFCLFRERETLSIIYPQTNTIHYPDVSNHINYVCLYDGITEKEKKIATIYKFKNCHRDISISHENLSQFFGGKEKVCVTIYLYFCLLSLCDVISCTLLIKDITLLDIFISVLVSLQLNVACFVPSSVKSFVSLS